MLKAACLVAAVTLTAPVATPSLAQSPQPMPTKNFVQAAAESDQFEIQEGRVATVESQNPQVRAFAQEMIQDHSRTTQALQQATAKAGLPPPPMALNGDQQKMLTALQSQSGPDFDRTYARQQVLAHQEALVVEQGYASGGSNVDVRQAAQSAVPIIQSHLQMAQQLRASIGGS